MIEVNSFETFQEDDAEDLEAQRREHPTAEGRFGSVSIVGLGYSRVSQHEHGN